MIILPCTLFTLCFLPGFHSFTNPVLPNSQQSNSISYNSPVPADQGLRSTINSTDGAASLQDSKPASTNQQPAFPNQRPLKTPANSPPSGYYPQYNPSVLYINHPYSGQNPNYPPTPYGDQPPTEPPKRGFWDFLSWPRTWLFGTTEKPPTPATQYSVLTNPKGPYQYGKPSPAPPTSESSILSAPQAPLRHPQGLYQVPPPNSKYSFVPISPKFPSYFPTQPQGDDVARPDSYNNLNPTAPPPYPVFKTQPANPSTAPAYSSTAKPSEAVASKDPYGSAQPAYSIYLVPAKPIYPPSTSYEFAGPNPPQYPVPYRPPQFGMPNPPAQPYYQNPMDYGYHLRNPYFNIPQPSDAVYPKYPSTIKPDCCATPKAHLADAAVDVVPQETVNGAVDVVPQATPTAALDVVPQETPTAAVDVVPQETPTAAVDVVPQETPTAAVDVVPQETPTAAVDVVPQETLNAALDVVPQETPTAVVDVVTANATSSTTPSVTTSSDTTTVTEAAAESNATSTAGPKPQARYLFSGKDTSRGWAPTLSV